MFKNNIGSHPDFLIIGAARSGTTSLYNALISHPKVYMPKIKEPSFYAFDNIKPDFKCIYGSDKYTNSRFYELEKYLALFKKKEAPITQGEASTIYLYSETAAKTIRKYNKNVKIIAVLRDPFERAYSAYNYNRMEMLEDLPFDEALKKETYRIENNWSPEYHYISKGLYGKQVRRYLAEFNKKNIKIILFDDLKNNFGLIVKDICEFIGIEADYALNISKEKNKSGVPTSLYQRKLRVFFAKPNYLRSIGKLFIPLRLRRKIAESLLYGNNRKGLTEPTPLPESLKRDVFYRYEKDLCDLEKLIGKDLSNWKIDA